MSSALHCPASVIRDADATTLCPPSCLDHLRFIKGSVCSPDLVNYVLRAEKIDHIMHFAAQTHVGAAANRYRSRSPFMCSLTPRGFLVP